MKHVQPKVTPIIIGTRLYTDSQNRGDAVVYAIHTEQTPTTLRYFGGATRYDVVFHDGVRSENLTESTLTSHRWQFIDGIATLAEIEELLAKSASVRAQNVTETSAVND